MSSEAGVPKARAPKRARGKQRVAELLVADRVGMSLDTDLDEFLAVLFKQVHIHHNSQDVAHFVGDVYEKPDGIFRNGEVAFR